MVGTENPIYCPKCRSAYIKIIKDNEKIQYTCENAVLDRPLCNWSEVEFLGEIQNNNRNSVFLADFLLKKYEDFQLNYEHLYLMGERLKIAQMPKLFKENKLRTEIESKIIYKYPDYKKEPIKYYFESIQKEFRMNYLKDENKEDISLVIVFLEAQKLQRILLEKRENHKFFSKILQKIEIYSMNKSNIFIIISNMFYHKEYFPLSEEFILFMKNSLNQKKTKIKLKRYILLPLASKNLIFENGVDEQLYHILHFTKSNQYYYNKKSILQESFWKKWEFGRRKTPYNPFGKDPGAFWTKASMSSELKKKIKDKDFKEQTKIVSISGQERFNYGLFNIFQAIGKCIILGSPVKSEVNLILPVSQISNGIVDEINELTQKLHRKLNLVKLGEKK